MLLGFIYMAFLIRTRGYGDTSILLSKDSSASDTFQTEVPLCRKIIWVLHSVNDAKQRKPKTWHDVTWGVKGGFPRSSENN